MECLLEYKYSEYLRVAVIALIRALCASFWFWKFFGREEGGAQKVMFQGTHLADVETRKYTDAQKNTQLVTRNLLFEQILLDHFFEVTSSAFRRG